MKLQNAWFGAGLAKYCALGKKNGG